MIDVPQDLRQMCVFCENFIIISYTASGLEDCSIFYCSNECASMLHNLSPLHFEILAPVLYKEQFHLEMTAPVTILINTCMIRVLNKLTCINMKDYYYYYIF